MNYTYLYKKSYITADDLSAHARYDIFISMFSTSERVLLPADKIIADQKYWIADERDKDNLFLTGKTPVILNSNEDYITLMKWMQCLDLAGKRICIDSTGFTTPYLMFILRMLSNLKISEYDVLYSEPKRYKDAESTEFSQEFYDVQQIWGLAGKHQSNTDNDLLVIAAGYDHSRIIDVATKKKSAKKVLMFGFPPMSAEMYQENILRAYKASEAIGTECFRDLTSNIYAPANDPFATAQELKEYIELNNTRKPFTNIYLAPLSSKPQSLGIALYYISEKLCLKNYSIIDPLCKKYFTDISEGISKYWIYHFEIPW